MSYFKIKNFQIINGSTNSDYDVPEDLMFIFCNEIYHLEDNTKEHYDPKTFFNYLIDLSKSFPDTTYYVYYKYDYYNHSHIKEYKNALQIKNSVIINDLASKLSYNEYMALGRKKLEIKIII